MHTVWRGETHWVVGFDNGTEMTELFHCDTLATASQIVSFLNGGPQPPWFPDMPGASWPGVSNWHE